MALSGARLQLAQATAGGLRRCQSGEQPGDGEATPDASPGASGSGRWRPRPGGAGAAAPGRPAVAREPAALADGATAAAPPATAPPAAGVAPAAAGASQQPAAGTEAKAPTDADDLRRGRWEEAGACAALCQLILDDRHCSGQPRRRPPLPPQLWAEMVAPFLRFDELMPDMLYAFGGRNQTQGPLSTTEMFDTWHGRWVLCEPMPTRRAGSAAALLPDGRMIVVGGYNEKGIAEGLLDTCDVFDPSRQCWVEGGAPPLRRARWGHGCAVLRGRAYAVGGCSLQADARPREAFMETLKSCEVLDLERGQWFPCAPLQIARSGARLVALQGDRYLAAAGGCDDVFGRAETQPTVELFDVVAGTWSLLESQLVNPRRDHRRRGFRGAAFAAGVRGRALAHERGGVPRAAAVGARRGVARGAPRRARGRCRRSGARWSPAW
ncbi:unnamed protein product [Prorocentrum cordatum]|uniref:Uncharacterized protein n=1 Tax=Prorocentrum cordatum TaxID=2364126 RepID=A0ABN9U2D4_9DINO|nr:unnamed protein product [Polarella glacialis]